MDTRGERLGEFIKHKSPSMRAFCKEYGFSYSSLTKITNGEIQKELGLVLIDRFAEAFPELNLNWLLYGRGSMTIDPGIELHDAEVNMLKYLSSNPTLLKNSINYLETKNDK